MYPSHSRQNFNPRHPHHAHQNFMSPRYPRHPRQLRQNLTHPPTSPTHPHTHATHVNDAFSHYSEIIFGVLQGPIMGLLLFNYFICDIFFDIIECDIASYADDNTPYNFDFNLINVISNSIKTFKLPNKLA